MFASVGRRIIWLGREAGVLDVFYVFPILRLMLMNVLLSGLGPNLHMSLMNGSCYTCMFLSFIALTLFCRLLNKFWGIKLTSSVGCLCNPQSP